MSAEQQLIMLDPRALIAGGQKVRSEEGDLEGLADTIRQHGVLQPLGVTRDQYGYRLVYGHRRRDAAIIAGLREVPCILLEAVSEDEAVVPQVLENLQRLDLNDMDKSNAFGILLNRLTAEGLSQGDALDSLAHTLGLSVRQIQRYLRLRTLSNETQQLISQDLLSVTQAQHLAELTPADRQNAVATLVAEENLSAAETGRLCEALRRNTNIDPAVALAMLRRGERVPRVEVHVTEAVPQFSTGTAAIETQAPWDEPDQTDDEQEPDGAETADEPVMPAPLTHDGNRIRKIHSLDSFMDELQRLAACVQEGDLQRLISQDPAAGIKLKLALRQCKFLAEALAALVALE